MFFLSCVCYMPLRASVYMCLVVTCWERADSYRKDNQDEHLFKLWIIGESPGQLTLLLHVTVILPTMSLDKSQIFSDLGFFSTE